MVYLFLSNRAFLKVCTRNWKLKRSTNVKRDTPVPPWEEYINDNITAVLIREETSASTLVGWYAALNRNADTKNTMLLFVTEGSVTELTIANRITRRKSKQESARTWFPDILFAHTYAEGPFPGYGTITNKAPTQRKDSDAIISMYNSTMMFFAPHQVIVATVPQETSIGVSAETQNALHKLTETLLNVQEYLA